MNNISQQNSNGSQSKTRHFNSLKGNWSGSIVCSDGMSWYAVAQFERDCNTVKKGVPFNDIFEGIWQHNDAINSISCKNFIG
jgi:hypothetical protein